MRLPGLRRLVTIIALATMSMEPSAWAGGTANAGLCPPNTYLDDVSCVRARATCGGWDGTSCRSGEPARAAAPAGNLAWAFDEASSICSAGDTSYSGSIADVLKAVDKLSSRAGVLRRSVDRDVAGDASPGLRVAALAAVGEAYDCIWTGLREYEPMQFTPKQQTLQARLRHLLQLPPSSAAPGTQLSSTQQQALTQWLVEADERLAILERTMLDYYATSALLARRYALEGFGLSRAAERLPRVAAILGDQRMARELSEIEDPTDPEPDARRRRHLTYSPASFRNAVSW
jgi:hypothetical protein